MDTLDLNGVSGSGNVTMEITMSAFNEEVLILAPEIYVPVPTVAPTFTPIPILVPTATPVSPVPTVSSSSGFGWGEQLEYGNNRLFYLASVTQEEAQKLFDHLVQVEFFDPENDVVIQLRKEEGIYEVRMPIKDGIDPTDANIRSVFKTAACELETLSLIHI